MVKSLCVYKEGGKCTEIFCKIANAIVNKKVPEVKVC